MAGMLAGCCGLTSLDVRGFKTDNVTDMGSMFAGCSGLTSLDLTGFDTINVVIIYWMFYGCSGLKTIYVYYDWTLPRLRSYSSGHDMFTGCTSLVGGAGTRYDDSRTDYTYANIDGESGIPGYFTRKGGSGEKPEGDLSGDGKVASDDVVALVGVMKGGSKDKLADADLNGDGKVDVADLVMLVKMIVDGK
jgi:surface protein